MSADTTSGLSPPTQDAVTQAFTAYLTFLSTTPLLDAESLHLPPAEGWPTLQPHSRNANALRRIGKTDAAIALLARLPYVDQRSLPIAGNSTKQVDYFTKRTIQALIDAADDELLDVVERCTFAPPWQVLDGNVLCLTNGEREESYLLLDTETWLVREYNQSVPPRDDQGGPDKSERAWRRLPEKNFVELLEGWKKKYIDLDWCPVPEYWSTTLVEGLDDNGKIDEAYDIYQDHGWPGQDFHRDECKEELARLVARWDGDEDDEVEDEDDGDEGGG